MLHGHEKMLPRVFSVETRPDYNLLITFKNGERKIYNVRHLLKLPIYKNLAKVFEFARVEYGTVVWPGDIDISPDSLYINAAPLDMRDNKNLK